MKNKLSVRANLSWPSLKKTFEKCSQTKNINEQFCAFKQAEKYKVIIKLFPNILIKHIFSTKTVFSAYFKGFVHSGNELQSDTTILIVHFSKIAADKTV